MSKYDKLWEYIANINKDIIVMSFDEIENIIKIKIDHSFLSLKKELIQYGYIVNKISLKNKTVIFDKIKATESL